MSGKWKRVDPAEIKVGDRVRVVGTDGTELVGAVSRTPDGLNVGPYWFSTQASSWNIWYVRKPKPVKPEADKYDGHGVEHWHNRYEKQLAHSEQLQAANKNRRQKMQLLKKEAKDARLDVDGWAMRYAALAASINELPDEPTPPAPLTRPEEPPVGSFFRVERTGQVFARVNDLHCNQYLDFTGVTSWPLWVHITEPGDTITLLDLVERDA